MENEPSEKDIQDIKLLLEKIHKREFSLEEATNAAWDIRRLAHILFDVVIEEGERKEKLEEFPNGFHLDSGGTCLICRESASGKNSWFDKYGLKCMICQKAINNKVIPASIANKKESRYTKIELESYFNIEGILLNKYIRQGILKDRVIPGESKKVHLQLFLIKDNKNVLPPKKLLKSRTIKVIKDGEEYFTQEYWYEFVTPKILERLKKYKIIDCLAEAFARPIKSGRFLYKGINPLFTHRDLD